MKELRNKNILSMIASMLIVICSCSSDDKQHTIVVDTASVAMEAQLEQRITIKIETDAKDWNYHTDRDWLSIEKLGSFLILNAPVNRTKSIRQAIITITAGNAEPVEINVSQKCMMYDEYIVGDYTVKAISYGETSNSPWEVQIEPYLDYYICPNFDGEPDLFLLMQFRGNTHAIINDVVIAEFYSEGKRYDVIQQLAYIEGNSLYLYDKEYWNGKWSADWKLIDFYDSYKITSSVYSFSFPVVVFLGVYDEEYNWQGIIANPYSSLSFFRQEGTTTQVKSRTKTRENRPIRLLTQEEKGKIHRVRDISEWTIIERHK